MIFVVANSIPICDTCSNLVLSHIRIDSIYSVGHYSLPMFLPHFKWRPIVRTLVDAIPLLVCWGREGHLCSFIYLFLVLLPTHYV